MNLIAFSIIAVFRDLKLESWTQKKNYSKRPPVAVRLACEQNTYGFSAVFHFFCFAMPEAIYILPHSFLYRKLNRCTQAQHSNKNALAIARNTAHSCGPQICVLCEAFACGECVCVCLCGCARCRENRLNAYDSIIIISYRALHVCFKILGQAYNLCNWKLVLISHSHKFRSGNVPFVEKMRENSENLFEWIDQKTGNKKEINRHRMSIY